MNEIAENLARIRSTIESAVQRSKRPPGSVTLVAVSKFVPAERIVDAVEAGQLVFGENYVQEGVAKFAVVSEILRSREMPCRLDLHLIGALQSNKAKRAVGAFSVIETVESEKLLRLLASEAAKMNKTQHCLLQVNISNEQSKSGAAVGCLERLLNVAQELPHISLRGMMSIGTAPENGVANRREFAELRELRDVLEQRCGISLPELSMGMSSDFVEAIEEGSTIVRVGSAIFGERIK